MTTETTTAADETEQTLFDQISFYRVALYAVLIGMIGFFLAPIEAGLVTSFKTIDAVTRTASYAPPGPEGFTLQKWQTAFDTLLRGLINSFIFAAPATIISALLGSMAAYGLTQIDWRGQIPILALFIAGIFIPYQAVLVPLSKIWSTYIPLSDLLWPLWAITGVSSSYGDLMALSFSHIAYGIPICMLLFRSYYKSMSDDIVEAARLDGASVRKIYQRIVLPLSKPMFAVVLIYQFTQIWNDLLFALILLTTSSNPAAPVTLILAGLGEAQQGTDFALRMAGALLTALPTLIIYILFGEEFAKGVAT
ncbi:carbohydrate ABC transporter membrane protein 2, CUT1 family [Natronoarchaeum philippinense]|uniref:Carbohydrate ABC transporter membrane protein 2, CUT1 family n=1 Tax=Natronoarchaeum philippinense TaxID=558529 RepID=A0A285N1U0_NATPI|nr:carbohydrate ABC transporter permease [Natronoarchaeum philippinense]SNZ03445.1 carbohydrate ABC transporter membrane protein 2, CUT1 family [Natronoarchaeum philippinense]